MARLLLMNYNKGYEPVYCAQRLRQGIRAYRNFSHRRMNAIRNCEIVLHNSCISQSSVLVTFVNENRLYCFIN